MVASCWNEMISQLPLAHALQTQEWAEVKAEYGWKPFFLAWPAEGALELRSEPWVPEYSPVAAALVLQRTIPIAGFAARLRVMYCPKGPVFDWYNAGLRGRVLADLKALARKQGAIFIKIDPDVVTGTGFPDQPEAEEDPQGRVVTGEMQLRGWRFSDEQVQFRNTVLIDLIPPEEDLLANMKQKTRYNVRLASRKGVSVRPGSLGDLDLLYRMYAETSVRDGFVIRGKDYYHKVWSTFLQAGLAEPLIAEVEGEPVAAVIIFRFAGKAWYMYGMSRQEHREKMPNYLLQWEAMRRARQVGCVSYDLWGAPDEFTASDPLWGVYRFKEGFGGQVVRHLGAWDLPTRRVFYQLYTQTLPRLLNIMRRKGKAETRREIANG